VLLPNRDNDSIHRRELIYTIGTPEDCNGQDIKLGVFDNPYEAEYWRQQHEFIHERDFNHSRDKTPYRNISYQIIHYTPGTIARLRTFRWIFKLNKKYPNLPDKIIHNYSMKLEQLFELDKNIPRDYPLGGRDILGWPGEEQHPWFHELHKELNLNRYKSEFPDSIGLERFETADLPEDPEPFCFYNNYRTIDDLFDTYYKFHNKHLRP
jgi:hypothetical protein